MTWTKIGDEFGDECAAVDLTDAAFRTHVEAITWAMRRGNGGHITDRDLARFAESPDAERAVKELLDIGFWQRRTSNPSGYQIVHHMEHQADPETITRRKKYNAERQRRYRRRQSGLPEEAPGPGGTDAP